MNAVSASRTHQPLNRQYNKERLSISKTALLSIPRARLPPFSAIAKHLLFPAKSNNYVTYSYMTSTPTPTVEARLQAFFQVSHGIYLIPELPFQDVPPMTLRYALANLASEGFLIRLARGVYYRPLLTEESHKRVLPDPIEVASTVARKSSMKLIPCMEHSSRVIFGRGDYKPYSFLTDGSSRKLKLYKGPTLEFLHTKEARLFTFKSELVRDISNGLRFLGKDNISEREKRIILGLLPAVGSETLREDIPKCPEWVREFILR